MADVIPTGPAWIPTFLNALAETGIVRQAMEAAGISPNSAYFQRKNNRRFAEAWHQALAPATAAPRAPAIAEEPAPARNAGWKTLFFETLAETSSVTASAVRANVPIRTVYKLKRQDREFALKWLAALHEGYDHLEMELLGHLRDPQPQRKMDVASALRLLAAHRATVERERALREEEDDEAVKASIDAFLEGMRQRRLANEAVLREAGDGDVAE